MKKPHQIDWISVLLFMLIIILDFSLVVSFEIEKQKLENQIFELTKALNITYDKLEETRSIILDGQAIPILPEEPVEIVEEVKIISEKDIIDGYIKEICVSYNIEPELIQSIVWHESRYNPNATNGDCIGLMQVSKRWHTSRAEALGVNDLYSSYGNILVGVDYICELIEAYDDPALALMLYNMDHKKAKTMYAEGKISGYATSVLDRANQLKLGAIQ